MSAPPKKRIILLEILSKNSVSCDKGEAKSILWKKYSAISSNSSKGAFIQLCLKAKKDGHIELLEENKKCYVIEITAAGKSYLEKHSSTDDSTALEVLQEQETIEAPNPKPVDDTIDESSSRDDTLARADFLNGIALATYKLSETFEEFAKLTKSLSESFSGMVDPIFYEQSSNIRQDSSPAEDANRDEVIEELSQKLTNAHEMLDKLKQDNQFLAQSNEGLQHELKTVRSSKLATQSRKGIGIKQVPKRLQPAYRAALNQGWTVKKSRGGHIEFIAPKGKKVVVSATPSDHRSVDNSIADLKRNGLLLD